MSKDRTQCAGCEDGTWSSANATECDQCPVGTVPTSDNTGCVECPAVSFRRGYEIETLIVELTAELLMSIKAEAECQKPC